MTACNGNKEERETERDKDRDRDRARDKADKKCERNEKSCIEGLSCQKSSAFTSLDRCVFAEKRRKREKATQSEYGALFVIEDCTL